MSTIVLSSIFGQAGSIFGPIGQIIGSELGSVDKKYEKREKDGSLA
ncbi:hypothetical protein [Wolbachia endosymbiont (group A) of Trypoxylon clavicerum]|nr:hypothetical protein [Wolbachia endosymbiont (group A) of Trypoxylon clavicerum]